MMPTDHLFRKGVATMCNSQPMIASKLELSPCAVSVLGQLFVEGPTSYDNITSKAGGCDLVSAGLASHEAGLSSLTPDGARAPLIEFSAPDAIDGGLPSFYRWS
jgi:hypothetical protein